MRFAKMLVAVLAFTIASGARAESPTQTVSPAKLDHTGEVKVINGAILLSLGAAIIVAGAYYGSCNGYCTAMEVPGASFVAASGVGALALGLPLVISGKSDLNKAARLRLSAAPYASSTGAGGTLRLTF
jgi:hypothetical protein